VPGGVPSRRLTFLLRDLRAPGLTEVRGFCLSRECRQPVRNGATAREWEGNSVNFCQLSPIASGRIAARMGTHETSFASLSAIGRSDGKPPKAFDFDLRAGMPRGRDNTPCSVQK
jgi:hypothetical protein